VRPRGLIIAIDGPSGAGKSTAGRAVAQRLGYLFLDTGAMYRALAMAALRDGVDLDDPTAVADLAHRIRLRLEPGGAVFLDGRDVAATLRTQEVGAAASRVSVHLPVRRHMVALQREMGQQGGVVMDGRDIGTAVFPDADVKFYVDAHPRQRAARRRDELAQRGHAADLETIEREIRERDHADSTRTESPLTRAPDAIHLDTTELGLDEVVRRILATVESTPHRVGG
jgi:cytidylate kinase